MISVIIPVGDGRDDNLSLALSALEQQTHDDFEVVVACDGNDGVDGVLRKHDLPITYCWQPASKKNLGAVNRNRGARLAQGEFLLFIDSDVLLNPNALACYAQDFTNFPHRAIAGPYHWCPPTVILPSEIADWDKLAERMFALLQMSKDEIRESAPAQRFALNHNMGMDGRTCWKADRDDLYCSYRTCLNLLSGNMAIHRDVFWHVGGFCEELTSGIDGEFGIRVCKAGQVYSFCKEAWGIHLYHDRAFALNWEDTKEKIIAMHHSDGSWVGRMKRDWGWTW